MSELKKFEYEGNSITFEFTDGNKMINATEMIKAFPGKRMNNFLRTQQTKDYIQLLESRYAKKRIADNQSFREILRVVKGGLKEQGTWMDEMLALKFAAWLSVEFELWVYDRIFELLTKSTTTIETRPSSNIIRSIRLLVDEMEQQDTRITQNKDDIAHLTEYVSDLEAKITSIDENYYSVSGYCALHSIECHRDKAIRLGKLCTAKSHSKNYEIGKAYDSKFGTVNTYHINILHKVIGK